MPKRIMIWKAAAMVAATTIIGACGGASQARSITLTFIRNAQSQANADGIIDTDVPGPSLTDEGKLQARQVAHSHHDFDSIYASPMVETQQTASPLASQLGKQVEIVTGLESLNAGWYNGRPESLASSTYMLAPAGWISGDIKDSIPGSVSGTDFNVQFSAAIRKIYNSGRNKPVVFSQGTAIMVWTLMNAKNAKSSLWISHPLPNTGRVVLTGNPITGWKLVDWDGIRSFT